MQCDSLLTGCFNDFVLDKGFALRSFMPVTIQPLRKHWLPSLGRAFIYSIIYCIDSIIIHSYYLILTVHFSLVLNPELECHPSWLEEDGTVLIQQCSSPHSNLEVINKTINWFFSNSTPSPAELEHWERGDICIGL
jgi:hypothetical protein